MAQQRRFLTGGPSGTGGVWRAAEAADAVRALEHRSRSLVLACGRNETLCLFNLLPKLVPSLSG
jgi:hypothetical protein